VDDYEVELLKPSSGIDEAFLPQLLSLLFGELSNTVGTIVSLSTLKQSLEMQKRNLELLTKLKAALVADLSSSGFYELLFGVSTLRRTRKGYEALDHLKGFKLFLSVTDKERFTFHNAPEKSPQQFMEYLPYAIAFDVERQWAKVFEGISLPNPVWYEGGSAGNFSAVGLSSSLGGFSSSFAASSGASASSGGGSSGGGGGGGGGGSW